MSNLHSHLRPLWKAMTQIIVTFTNLSLESSVVTTIVVFTPTALVASITHVHTLINDIFRRKYCSNVSLFLDMFQL